MGAGMGVGLVFDCLERHATALVKAYLDLQVSFAPRPVLHQANTFHSHHHNSDERFAVLALSSLLLYPSQHAMPLPELMISRRVNSNVSRLITKRTHQLPYIDSELFLLGNNLTPLCL